MVTLVHLTSVTNIVRNLSYFHMTFVMSDITKISFFYCDYFFRLFFFDYTSRDPLCAFTAAVF